MSDKPTSSTGRTPLGRARWGRLQKGAAIVPLALLSAAWTASLTGVGVLAPVSSAAADPGTLPGGASVPDQAIEAPATVSSPDQGSPTYTGKGAEQIVSTSSSNQIPAAALAAYQRAESIIDSADTSCHLTWQLVAAIGRVESNHGRINGSTLDGRGIAQPSIYGIRLNMADTDGGQIDGATGYDRAVGPMQFIPSTWQAVAVDADSDGKRNPQDINDAALGAAVYLCSGPGDLSTTTGQRDAVHRYNHSDSYVNLVLAIMDSYLNGDFVASPNDSLAGGYLTPLPASQQSHPQTARHHHQVTNNGPTNVPATPSPTPAAPAPGPKPSQPKPTSHPSTPSPPHLPTPHPTLPTVPTTGVPPVDHLLTTAQAIVQCTLDGYVDNVLSSTDPFDKCVTAYTTTGKPPKG